MGVLPTANEQYPKLAPSFGTSGLPVHDPAPKTNEATPNGTQSCPPAKERYANGGLFRPNETAPIATFES